MANNSNSVFCNVVAIPVERTYQGLEQSEAIERYKKMSGPDFGKQLTTSEEIVLEKEEIYIEDGPLSGRTIVRTVAPFNILDTWYDKPANKSVLGSLIYTEKDGFPIAEFCAIIDNMPPYSMSHDIASFFRQRGWDAKKDTSTLYIDKKKLDLESMESRKQVLLDVEKEVILEISKMIQENSNL